MKKLNYILDIDGVLANFCQGIIDVSEEYGLKHFFPSSPSEITSWNISEKFVEVFDQVKTKPEFWLNLSVLNKIDFIPSAYLTARPCKTSVTIDWLQNNGFPRAPVITVSNPLDKIPVLKAWNPNLFIDDHWLTIIECKRHGIPSLLYNQPYQIEHEYEIKQHNIKRINSLDNLEEYTR